MTFRRMPVARNDPAVGFCTRNVKRVNDLMPLMMFRQGVDNKY